MLWTYAHHSQALGVEISGQLVITSISPGSEAERVGLRPGDRVVNLNGIDCAHLSLIDAAYMLRREHSNVMLMRVQHSTNTNGICGETDTIHIDHARQLSLQNQAPVRIYENIRHLDNPVYPQPPYTSVDISPFWQGKVSFCKWLAYFTEVFQCNRPTHLILCYMLVNYGDFDPMLNHFLFKWTASFVLILLAF